MNERYLTKSHSDTQEVTEDTLFVSKGKEGIKYISSMVKAGSGEKVFVKPCCETLTQEDHPG